MQTTVRRVPISLLGTTENIQAGLDPHGEPLTHDLLAPSL